MKLTPLYPIVDLDAVNAQRLPPLDFAERVLTAKPAVLQLRAKHASAREVLALLRQLKPLCERNQTLLFANDRPDLALLSGADGVHLGQEDLPIAAVRLIAPRLLVGLSTHNPGELAAALAERPDYVAFGPVFATSSKERPEPVVGLDGLALAVAAARAAEIPLVAIGGIDSRTAPEVTSLGATAAIIGALLADSLAQVERAARLLNTAAQSWRST